MPPTDASARPSQVTVAGWAVTVGAVVVVAEVFSSMAGLHSVDTREVVTRRLSTGSWRGLGVSVDDALTAMRWAYFVSGAAAAAAAILGFFTLQRNLGARIGLTVVAVPIVLATPVTGSFMGMVVGAATAVLWSRPARDWFAGRPITPSARGTRRDERPPTAQPTSARPPSSQLPTAQPPVDQPPGGAWAPPTLPTSPAPHPPPAPVPYGQSAPVGGPWPPPQVPTGVATRSMPRQVRTACVVTWVFSAITALGYLVLLLAISIDSDGLMKVVRDSPNWDPSFDPDVVLTAAVVVSVLFLLWCVGAAVLAAFTWRGVRGAWIGLSVSTALAAAVSVVAFPYSLVHLAALAATAGMLMSKPARDWFSRR